MMESLTEDIYKEAKKIVDEVSKEGGMSKYIETGKPKLNIEKSAARRQANIDSGKEVIVGVNKYKAQEEEDFETLEVDNHKVRTSQINLINKIKKNRNQKTVNQCLDKITEAAKMLTATYSN